MDITILTKKKQSYMETKHLCQSCGMPIDRTEMQGTEKDGSKSDQYCVYCYVNGQLLNPGMTLGEMTDLVRTKLQDMHMPESFIQGAVGTLPQLRRWAAKPAP
jgi:hypothetical protein